MSLRALLRTQFVRVLTWHFRRVQVPHSFRSVIANHPGAVIITQSESAVVEALLESFSRRSEIKGLMCLEPGETPDRHRLAWGSMHRVSFVEALKQLPAEQFFSTLTIFSLRGPVKSNPSYRMSLFDLFLMLVLSRSAAVVLGTPFTFTEMERSGRRSPLRRIRLDFYKNLKLVRGIPFQSREEQARVIIESPEFTRELNLLAEKTRVSQRKMRRVAYQEFYRMAANPLRPMFSVLGFAARLLLRKLFTQVSVRGLDRLIPAVREETVVLVPMHRSHLDYIVLTSTLYDSHLNAPLVAAGMNLLFWPAGFLMRSVGAYFVRRDARQDRLHSMLLRHYVSYLVKRGHLQEFFIEGGRSRSGKMLPPKIGLLGIMVSTALKHRKHDTLFVPVSVTYENVIEDMAFGDENTGAPKRRENIFELLRAGRIFSKSYGDLIVNYGTPIPLAAAHRESVERRGEGDERQFVPALGMQIVRRIREQTNPSLMSLAYSALMMAPRYGLPRADFSRVIRNLARMVDVLRSVTPGISENTPTLQAFLGGRDGILLDVARGGVVEMGQVGAEQVFFIPGARRFTADFYRNSTIHLFFTLSILSILDLTREEINVEDAVPFHQILESDFLLETRDVFLEHTRALIEKLRDAAVLGDLKGKLRFVNRAPGIFCPGMLLAPIQSLAFSVNNLAALAQLDEGARAALEVGGGRIGYAELIRRIQSEARAARYVGMLSRTEAASKTSLTSAFETLGKLGIIRVREEGGGKSSVDLSAPDDPLLKVIFDANSAIVQWMTSQTLRDEWSNQQ